MTERKPSRNDPSAAGTSDRRGFLSTVGGMIASAALVGSDPFETLGGAASVGPVGVQLYTVRDQMKKDVASTLARVARTGYKEVEFAGYFGHSPKAIRRALTQDGLTAPSAHVGFPVLGASWDKIIADALVVGHQYLVCPWIDQKLRTVDGYKSAAELFNKAGEQAKKAGLKFGYHNHDFEFPPIDGQIPYDLLLANTDPSLVTMEMDVYWIRNGGKDPLDYFARYPGRFQMLHIKDMDSAGKMVAVGKGVIDWKAVLGKRALAGTKHIFVEHDQPTDAFASIRDSYRYLRALNV
jgi:sugar phosphate isomerase/epimerase